MHSFAAFLVRTDPSPIAYAVAAAAVLVLRRRRRRRLAGDDKRAAALLPFSQPTLGGGGGAGAGGGGQAVTVEVPAQHLVPGAALGTLPSVEERMEDEFAAPLATFPTRPSSASPAGAATLLGLASALPASPLAATSTAGLSQPQTPSLSSAGESLGSSTGRPSRPAAPEGDSGDAFLSYFTQTRVSNVCLPRCLPLISECQPLHAWRTCKSLFCTEVDSAPTSCRAPVQASARAGAAWRRAAGAPRPCCSPGRSPLTASPSWACLGPAALGRQVERLKKKQLTKKPPLYPPTRPPYHPVLAGVPGALAREPCGCQAAAGGQRGARQQLGGGPAAAGAVFAAGGAGGGGGWQLGLKCCC